jgi:protein-disulfide isomerase
MTMAESKKNERRERAIRQKQQQQIRWLIGAGMAVVFGMIFYFTWQETTLSSPSVAVAAADPTLGPESAPIEIVEYADFGCQACRAWHNAGIREQILATFGDQVRFVWKDFPVITSESPQAAEAGQCAAAQGKFWEFHDLVYEQFAGLGLDALRGYATSVALDMAAFDQCLDQRVMRPKVQTNDQEARRLGLRGTPGFAINGRPLPAPPSFDQLAALIQQELAQN